MRLKICIEYDGTSYVGWQKQQNGRSIQEEVEKCLKKIFKQDISIFGAGRTDAGVHAINQVAHFDINNNLDLNSVLASMNFFLRKNKNSISILNIKKVSKNFHARFSVKKKVYAYKILNRKSQSPLSSGKSWFIPYFIDLEAMENASKFLLGENDFNAFRSKNCQSTKSIRTINQINFKKLKDEIVIRILAKSFLHNQVRIIVGSLINVGRGHWEPVKLHQILKKKDRTFAGPTAPAEGLYLEKVLY